MRRSTGLRHTIGGELAPITMDTGAFARTNATGSPDAATWYRTAQGRLRSRQDSTTSAVTQNWPQRDFRLNLRPARARRLSEAGRHWAPIARQRATRKERHSGLTWPTYCNKPNGRRPSWTAWCALSPMASVAVQRKRNTCM